MQKSAEEIFPLGEEPRSEKIRTLHTVTAAAQNSAEEILPDYKGEIRRVLLEEAEIIPQENYASDTGEKLTGSVQYRLYYVDGGDQLNVAEFSSSYEITLPVGEGEKVLDSGVTILSYSVRATGPRKIAGRASLLAEALVGRESEGNVRIERTEEEEDAETAKKSDSSPAGERSAVPEMQKKKLAISDCVSCSVTEREYAEEGEKLEGVLPSDVEIITSGGSVRILTTKPSEGGVMLSGVIDLSCILRIGDGTPYAIGKSIPFEELIPYGDPNAQSGQDSIFSAARGSGTLTSVRAEATGDPQNEENTVLTLSAIAEYRASAVSDRSVSVVSDAYTVGSAYETEEEEFSYEKLTAVGRERRPVTLTVPIEGEAQGSELHNILRTFAFLPFYEARAAEDTVTVSGKIIFFAIADRVEEDGKIKYYVQKGEFEFDENVKMSGQIDANSVLHCRVKAENVSSVINGENIDFSAELSIEVFAFAQCSDRRVTAITAGEADEKVPSDTVTVYYPGKGDTLWSVAKHYGKPLESIAAQNSLTDEQRKNAALPVSLQGVEKLLIC